MNPTQSQSPATDPIDDTGSLAAYRTRYARALKTDVMQQLAEATGYGMTLVQHWLRHDKNNPQAVEFFETCGHAYTHELGAVIGSGLVMEDWRTTDWRGQRGQTPTPKQVLEQALKTQSRIQLEIAQRQPQPARRAPGDAQRQAAIDLLPALY